jgi:hypothetical protein
MGDAEQTALAEWNGDDEGDDGGEIDDLRRDVDRLTDMVDTLADSQEQLARLVETHLPDDSERPDTDPDDGERLTTADRGFQ